MQQRFPFIASAISLTHCFTISLSIYLSHSLSTSVLLSTCSNSIPVPLSHTIVSFLTLSQSLSLSHFSQLYRHCYYMYLVSSPQ